MASPMEWSVTSFDYPKEMLMFMPGRIPPVFQYVLPFLLISAALPAVTAQHALAQRSAAITSVLSNS